jgi:Cu+-exporting ATPase
MKMNIQLAETSSFETLPGLGVKATVGGRVIFLGNPDLMAKFAIPLQDYTSTIERLQGEGKTVATGS